jgi:hypothetical protein
MGSFMFSLERFDLLKKWYLWAAITLLTFSPLVVYFMTFGPLSEFKLSKSDQAWANFGSYLSGTVGPLISILAFIGLFITIKQQQASLTAQAVQLKELEKQRVIDNIQANINEQSRNIDALLYSKIPVTIGDAVDSRMSLFSIIVLVSELEYKAPETMTEDERKHLLLKGEYREQAIADMYRLGLEFNLLCNLWDEFISAGGNPFFIKLQKKKYVHTLTNLRFCGIRFRTIDKHFDFNKLRTLCIGDSHFEDLWNFFDDDHVSLAN